MAPAPPPLALSTAALVLANLVPLGGALLGIWTVYELILLFWAENLVIGLYQLLRMGAAATLRRDRGPLLLIPFFLLHYGIFTFVHGQFVVGMLAPSDEDLRDALAMLASPAGLLWPVLALAASHGVSFVVNFLGEGEWRGTDAQQLMQQPYARVVVLHLVILAGGGAVLVLGEPVVALVALVVLKIAADIVAHRREHSAAAVTRRS